MLSEGPKNTRASVLEELAQNINWGMTNTELLSHIIAIAAGSHNHELYAVTLREALKLKQENKPVLNRLTQLIKEQHGGYLDPDWNTWYDAFGQNPRHQYLITF